LEALADYQANRLSVYRQVHFSSAKPALSVDVVLALNGLPVATLELKNPLTSQSAEHAQRQYKERNERDPIPTKHG
jgi:type I restriction enzyme, R subunit